MLAAGAHQPEHYAPWSRIAIDPAFFENEGRFHG